MSLQNSMLRCPEQTMIRYADRPVGATGHIERNGSDNRQGCVHSTFAPNATTTAETTKGDGHISGSRVFETTTGTDIRRPQVRGERDGQSTDSGISDLSDKEDENIKHLSPNVTNAYMAVTPATRPPNAVAIPNGAVSLRSSHANIQRVETNTSASISPEKHACDREPVRNVGKNSPHDGALGQATITILNPPSGMHGPGRFRDDPRIDSKYVGMDNAAAVALDLTANHSPKTSSKTVTSIPGSAHLHPSLVARLNQPEQAIRPLMDRFGAVSQENISMRSNPEPVIMSSSTPPNSSNSIPSYIKTRPPFHPIIHSQQPPGAMYDPFKLDRGLTQGMSPVQPLIPDHARNGGTCIPGSVAGELSVKNESRPLSDTVMPRLCSNGRTTKTKREETRPTINTGVPSPVGRPLTSNAQPVAMSLSNTGAPIQTAYNGVPQHVYYGPCFNTRESQPVSRTLPNRGITEPSAQPINTSQLINSADQPNQPSSIRNAISCQSAGQYIQNYPVSQQHRFPNQQDPSMTNTFPRNGPQLFPYYTPRFQVGPPLPYTNNFQHQAVRTRGPGCANFYPNQLPAPSVNPAQMYQMRPQMMPFGNQQQTVQGDFVPRSKTRKRKYTRKRNNDATPDKSNEITVNKIITDIMAQCQRELPPVPADKPDSGSDRKDAHREILTVKSNIPDRAMNTNTLSSVSSGTSMASESGVKVQSRPEVNYGDILTSIAPRTPPQPGLSSGPAENIEAMYNPARAPRQSIVNGTCTVTTASFSCSSVRASSKSPGTSRISNSGTDNIANSSKIAEKCNMRNEGLGERFEHQRSPSVPNKTEQGDSNKSRNLPPYPAAAPGRNIFEEVHVTPTTSSRSSLAEQTTDISPVPSSESNIQNRQLVSLAADRKTASPNDQSSSYHRNLPKKRHLFEKHLSDSCISTHADLNEHKGTLPVDVQRGATCAMQVEDSRISFTAPKSSEEQYKRDISSQSEISSEAPRSTRMGPQNPFKNEEVPPVAQNQPPNSTQKEQCDVNLGDPQLQDSSQNPRPPAPIPCLFNYRFRPPTDVAPQNTPTVFHGGQMQPMVQSWPPMMPYYQCQPQMAPYRFPSSIPNNQNRMTAPSQVPPQRFDVKEKLAMYMKEKQDRKKNTTMSHQPEPGKESTIPVDPRYVPLHMLPPPHQNGTLVFVDQNGVEWRPVDTKCSQPIQYSDGVRLVTPDSAQAMSIPDRAVKQVVPQKVDSNKHYIQKEVLPHINNSQKDQQQQQQQDVDCVNAVNAGKCERLASDVKQTDVNFEIVMNTSRLTGVDGVIINVDEQTLRDERSRKRRGRKRKVPETALVPENVFVRAEERRKRHKLLPTPEALALGKTNTEDNEPHSLRSLAACAFSKLQSNEHFLKPANTLNQATPGSTPFEARVKAKQLEVLAENMIASLVSDACAEREHRKTGLPVFREKTNERDWSYAVDKYAPESNQNINPLAVVLRPSQVSNPDRSIARSGDNILAPLEQVMRVQETDARKDVEKQRVDSGFAGLSGNERNVDVRHYRPKAMKKPKARIEDITETIMEVVRDSVTGQSNSGDKDVAAVADIEVSSMGTVEVHTCTEPFEETSTEKEVTSLVDYEAQLQEILRPKAPAVVSEILEDMQLELRECLPETASTEDIDSDDSSSEESSDSDSDDEVHLGTVMLDGKEYRMRVVVEEDASRDRDGSESDSESNEESNCENRTTSTASAEMSFEDSYVEEGVDTFQDVETFDDEDDVFMNTEDNVDSDPRRGMVKGYVSVINKDTDSDDGERDISHKRTTSCSSTDYAVGRDCNAQEDHTLSTETGAMDVDVILSQQPDLTCEISHKEPQFASEDVSKSTKSSGTTETEKDQFRSTKSNEVYVIENFNYTDKNGYRHDSIDEDKITDAIDIDESVTHQVDIEFVKAGPHTPSFPETLFERFGVNGPTSSRNSSDDEEDCHMYVTEPDVAISVELAGDKTELNCPGLSPRALQVPISPEPSPRLAQKDSSPMPSPLPIADTPIESDSMPVLFPCCVEQEPPIVNPCDEEPPILQYLGKPKNLPPSDRNETDSSPLPYSTSRNLCVRHIDFSESSRKQLKTRKKPKMISVLPQKAMLRDENDKENNDRHPSECISNANITTPERRARKSFRSSISRFSNGYHSDSDQGVVDYEKPSAGRNNGPSPVMEAKSRPFSPVNYPNAYPNPKDRVMLDYCCQCGKNGKLRSPNRLHSLDELCPYARYTCTKITDDPQYDYPSSDELIDSGGRRRSGRNGFKVDITNESKIHVNTDPEFVIHGISKPNPIRTSSSDLKGEDLMEANATGDNDKTVPYIQETAAETDDRSQFDDGLISVPDCDMDALLNQFELSSDGTDSSLYRDDNGCDDFLYSSYESPTRLSDSIYSLKAQNEMDTDSDDSQPQSEFGQIEPDSDLCDDLNDLQKCWVDLCDIGNFLQGKSRVKISDFVLYNESLCKPPPVSVFEILIDRQAERLEHEQRIHQLKNKLKEVQRQVNLHLN